MKFFIDTADLDEIQEASEMGVLDGVTTNPSLMKIAAERAGQSLDFHEHIARICDMVPGDVSAEVTAVDFDGIMEQGRSLAAIRDNVVVKVPLILDGSRPLMRLPRRVFGPTARFVSRPRRHSWLLKLVQRISVLSWGA